MSFVLEALKKQEAGSDPDAAVSLARSADQRRRHRLWMTLFGVAMAVNALLLFGVFVLPHLEAPEPETTASPPAPASTPAPDGGASRPEAMEAESSPGPETAPAPAAVPTPEPVSAAPPPVPPERTAAQAPTRVALADLPRAVRSRFPGIAFSTHIYAEDADLRAVVANGQRLTEGDSVRGLEVVEITERGVVLGFERYEVEVPIVTDWDAL